jgi:hypothetical protein
LKDDTCAFESVALVTTALRLARHDLNKTSEEEAMRPIAWAIVAGASPLSASLTEPAAAKTNSSAIVPARQKFFGLEIVDPRSGAVHDARVITSWLTNPSFAATLM